MTETELFGDILWGLKMQTVSSSSAVDADLLQQYCDVMAHCSEGECLSAQWCGV